jgi:3-hydroxyanthranilate 3,4-dioxygenase
VTAGSVIPHIERKRFLNVFPLAGDTRSYDERPLILEHIDPQLYLSRNAIAQPFFLVCEKDTVLAAMSGDADVEFRDTSVLRQRLAPGDFIYVPAGTPHRIVPREPSLHVRYKAREAGFEGVAWYCDGCATERRRLEWDTATELPQEAYARACRIYAESIAGSACTKCGERAPALDLGDIRWDAVAAELRRPPAAETAT